MYTYNYNEAGRTCGFFVARTRLQFTEETYEYDEYLLSILTLFLL